MAISPAPRPRAWVVPVRWLPPGIAAMTLRRHVLVRRERVGDSKLLAHELVHVRQWTELGTVRFLWRYLGHYFRGRACGLSHAEAYRRIPLEREAEFEAANAPDVYREGAGD